MRTSTRPSCSIFFTLLLVLAMNLFLPSLSHGRPAAAAKKAPSKKVTYPPMNQVLSKAGVNYMEADPVDFSFQGLDGKEVKLSDFKGKWIWLNFWATWCGPCLTEIPALNNIQKTLKGSKFTLISM